MSYKVYTVYTYLKNQARLSWVTCTYETETNTTVVGWFFSTLLRPIMDVVSLNSSRRLRRIKICCIHWSNNLIIHYVKRVHRLRFRYICNSFFYFWAQTTTTSCGGGGRGCNRFRKNCLETPLPGSHRWLNDLGTHKQLLTVFYKLHIFVTPSQL